MPQTLEQITILISHTNEMSEHAKLVSSRIESMSRFVVADGYSLRATSWKKDPISGHASDGQTVVNTSIVQNADIVVALFGTKVGTSTSRSISGTTEELYLVKNRPNNPFGPNNAQVFFLIARFLYQTLYWKI